MFETAISLLAIVCSASVALMCVLRWRRSRGYKAAVYLVVSIFSALVALLNVSSALADDSFIRTATLAYIGFATAVVLPVARALGDVTYEAPEDSEENGTV